VAARTSLKGKKAAKKAQKPKKVKKAPVGSHFKNGA